MIILGINAYHGDASVAVIKDGQLLFAAEEERFNRIKHSAGIPVKAFQTALKRLGISPDEVDYLTISRNPSANLIPKINFVLHNRPPLSFLKDRIGVSRRSGNMLEALDVIASDPKGLLCRAKQSKTGLLRPFGPRNDVKLIHVEHHLAHAASAFYPSGFDQAALLTVDGFGDFSSVLFGIGEGNRMKVLKRVLFPHSLGILYTAVAQYLGFPKYGDEYKVMGLAAWGEPRFLKEFHELLKLEPEGDFKLNLDYFVHPQGKGEMSWAEGEPVLGAVYSDKWQALFGLARRCDDPITQQHKDLAATAQSVFEEAFFHLLKYLHEKTKLKTLCLAGGCAMNSVANGKIFSHTPFDKVYIQPAAGDAGTALGGALYLAHHRLNQPRNFRMEHAYWGPEFSEVEIERALAVIASARLPARQASPTRRARQEAKPASLGDFSSPFGGREARDDDMTIEKVQDQNALCVRAAKAISEGKVVGWFQGKMEWGARALGNRSILADPRHPGMKDILNQRIKHREGFRPFAPSVLEEKASEWFEMKTTSSPFMNLVFPVRNEKKEKIPAVTHIDGTARVHTVTEKTNAPYAQLIREFEKITGVPMLLNTSFNENEPIACNPNEALECFLRTHMDVLVLGPYLIERKHESAPSLKS